MLPAALFDTLQELNQQTTEHLPALPYALSDFQLVKAFLKQYDGNRSTYNAYRREVERLTHWSWLIKNHSIVDIVREEVEEYVHFCQSPPKSWIALKKAPRFIAAEGKRIANPQWRPFVVSSSKVAFRKTPVLHKEDYQLSQKATREIFVIIGSLYQYLNLEGICLVNPVTQIRQKSKFLRRYQEAPKIPRLSDVQWRYVIETTQEMAAANPDQHERSLFILSALYLMYLRISELTANERWIPLMRHFYKDSDENWWFMTVGKGNKERHITVCDAMLQALKRYRLHYGFSALPSPHETAPLISKLRGKGPVTSDRMIRVIVQSCFDQAVLSLRKDKLEQEAETLQHATVHWLRHTGISDDINKYERSILHVRDDAGHFSIATTDRYNDAVRRERHASAKNKRLNNEP